MSDGDLVKIGALWKGKTKKGESMLSGLFGDARLLIFKNGYKTEEKHPDFIAYVANRNKDADSDNSFFNDPQKDCPPGHKIINGVAVKINDAEIDGDVPF